MRTFNTIRLIAPLALAFLVTAACEQLEDRPTGDFPEFPAEGPDGVLLEADPDAFDGPVDVTLGRGEIPEDAPPLDEGLDLVSSFITIQGRDLVRVRPRTRMHLVFEVPQGVDPDALSLVAFVPPEYAGLHPAHVPEHDGHWDPTTEWVDPEAEDTETPLGHWILRPGRYDEGRDRWITSVYVIPDARPHVVALVTGGAFETFVRDGRRLEEDGDLDDLEQHLGLKPFKLDCSSGLCTQEMANFLIPWLESYLATFHGLGFAAPAIDEDDDHWVMKVRTSRDLNLGGCQRASTTGWYMPLWNSVHLCMRPLDQQGLVARFFSATPGDWTVTVDGEAFTYTAGGGDGPVAIAEGLAEAVSDGRDDDDPFWARTRGGELHLTHRWRRYEDIALSVTPPSGGSVSTFRMEIGHEITGGHELFHGVQGGHNERSTYGTEIWTHLEGTASASELSTLTEANRQPTSRLPHAVNLPLIFESKLTDLSSRHYDAQDFWVYGARYLGTDLSWVIPVLDGEGSAASIQSALNAYGANFGTVYWSFLRNQLMERRDSLGPDPVPEAERCTPRLNLQRRAQSALSFTGYHPVESLLDGEVTEVTPDPEFGFPFLRVDGFTHFIPSELTILVSDGDVVSAGDPLTDSTFRFAGKTSFVLSTPDDALAETVTVGAQRAHLVRIDLPASPERYAVELEVTSRGSTLSAKFYDSLDAGTDACWAGASRQHHLAFVEAGETDRTIWLLFGSRSPSSGGSLSFEVRPFDFSEPSVTITRPAPDATVAETASLNAQVEIVVPTETGRVRWTLNGEEAGQTLVYQNNLFASFTFPEICAGSGNVAEIGAILEDEYGLTASDAVDVLVAERGYRLTIDAAAGIHQGGTLYVPVLLGDSLPNVGLTAGYDVLDCDGLEPLEADDFGWSISFGDPSIGETRILTDGEFRDGDEDLVPRDVRLDHPDAGGASTTVTVVPCQMPTEVGPSSSLPQCPDDRWMSQIRDAMADLYATITELRDLADVIFTLEERLGDLLGDDLPDPFPFGEHEIVSHLYETIGPAGPHIQTLREASREEALGVYRRHLEAALGAAGAALDGDDAGFHAAVTAVLTDHVHHFSPADHGGADGFSILTPLASEIRDPAPVDALRPGLGALDGFLTAFIIHRGAPGDDPFPEASLDLALEVAVIAGALAATDVLLGREP